MSGVWFGELNLYCLISLVANVRWGISCLDDEELELLGVPWETYRDVAAETGLDVIRYVTRNSSPLAVSISSSLHLGCQCLTVLLPSRWNFSIHKYPSSPQSTLCKASTFLFTVEVSFHLPCAFDLVIERVYIMCIRYLMIDTVGSSLPLPSRPVPLFSLTTFRHVIIGGVGRAGMTACAWAIKMGFVQPHPSLVIVEEAARQRYNLIHGISPSSNSSTPIAPSAAIPAELEHQIVMSMVERVIAMIRCRRGLKAIESFEQVAFLMRYVGWLRQGARSA